MTYTIYDAHIPGVVQTLNALSKIIDKAKAHAETKKIDPAVLVNYRLAPDMFAFARQIQITTDHAKGIAARVSKTEVPNFPDTETTLDELKARIAKTLDFIAGIPRAAFDGGEAVDISLKIGGNDYPFTGATYTTNFAIPNFYFHATSAYAILRHAGVALGKIDFMNRG